MKLLGSLRLKLIVGLLMLFFLVVGALWLHHAGVIAGRAEVQAKWDAAKDKEAAVAGQVLLAATRRTMDLQNQFDALSVRYQAATHAQPPSISESTAAGVADGSLRMRGESDCPVPADTVSRATARSRAADAAATQALADRTAAAIAAVRAGDEADARERQLGEQVTALQSVLKAERQH